MHSSRSEHMHSHGLHVGGGATNVDWRVPPSTRVGRQNFRDSQSRKVAPLARANKCAPPAWSSAAWRASWPQRDKRCWPDRVAKAHTQSRAQTLVSPVSFFLDRARALSSSRPARPSSSAVVDQRRGRCRHSACSPRCGGQKRPWWRRWLDVAAPRPISRRRTTATRKHYHIAPLRAERRPADELARHLLLIRARRRGHTDTHTQTHTHAMTTRRVLKSRACGDADRRLSLGRSSSATQMTNNDDVAPPMQPTRLHLGAICSRFCRQGLAGGGRPSFGRDGGAPLTQ